MNADRRLILAVEAVQLNALAQVNSTSFLPSLGASMAAVCDHLAGCGAWFGPRRALEADPKFRQIIPYVLLKNEDKFLTYVRGSQIEEDRLRNRVALGWGGHVDLPDAQWHEGGVLDLEATLALAVAREILEEVGIVTHVGSMTCMGLIVSSEDEVSSVHVGVVLVLEVVGTVASMEQSQHTLRWMSAEEIAALPANEQEGWTGVVGPRLAEYLEQTAPEETVDVVQLPLA